MAQTIDIRRTIAKRVAGLLEDKSVVNLGIGIPTLVPNYIEEDKEILLQSENGVLGVGRAPTTDDENDQDYFDAGSSPITVLPGGSFVDSSIAFGLIRGGRIDATVLGALQVDQMGNIANWLIPDKMLAGYGGAMDLVAGCPLVIVAMEHTNKGTPKILRECNFPLTGVNCVRYIVTELGLFECVDNQLILRELTEGVSIDQVYANTEAEVLVDERLGIMEAICEKG